MSMLAPGRTHTQGYLLRTTLSNSDILPVGELRGVSKWYRVAVPGGRHRTLRAVERIDLVVRSGRTLGLVGESGSGKSTAARLMLKLIDPSEGRIYLDGADITDVTGSTLRRLRRRMQLVFQDPSSSFDPLSSIRSSIDEALRRQNADRASRRVRVAELLEMVGLAPAMGSRHPHELSGGQLQRAAIGRALAAAPGLVALDEPVSSLDVSSQAHIVNLLIGLQEDLGVGYLFISHDLSVIRDVCHEIAVMYLGQIVESGPADRVYSKPEHPYTQALLSAAPTIQVSGGRRRDRLILHDDIPSALSPPTGCRFHTRCPFVMDVCRDVVPVMTQTSEGNLVACHLYAGSSDPVS